MRWRWFFAGLLVGWFAWHVVDIIQYEPCGAEGPYLKRIVKVSR